MKVLLTAINAKYIHSSLAIRYLAAVTQDLPYDISSLELSINNHLNDIANRIFDEQPDILSVSCYIWNIELIKQLLPLISRILPNCKIILGGPEVSYEVEEFMTQFPMVDFIVRGEGEETFPKLLMEIYNNSNNYNIPGLAYKIKNQIYVNNAVTVENLDSIPFPYSKEDIESLKEKIIYYESSRGCPYSCKYCLSCATSGVRYRSLDKVFQELDQFIQADVKQVKFVDRTFNADKKHFLPILKYIAKQKCRTNFHFEIVAYKIDKEVEDILAKMPKGRVQFEIGIQSTNTKTLGQVSRANHWESMVENINKILNLKTIHVHVDLIIGLPYENLDSFKQSFNDVYELKAHMLQVGFLKLLKGAGMNDLIDEHQYIYTPQAPYQIISNKYMDYGTLRKLEIFVDVLEHFYNSGFYSYTMDTLVTNYPNGAYEFYAALAEFWFNKNMHLAAHSPQKLVDFLIDFIESNTLITNKEQSKNTLKFDLLMKYQGRYKNKSLPWKSINKVQRDHFFKSKSLPQYIKEYEFKSWRDLMNNYHIELFDYNIMNPTLTSKLDTPMALLFSYKSNKYQHINLGGLILE